VPLSRRITGEDTQKLINSRVEIMMKITMKLLGEEWWQATRAMMNTPNRDDEDDGDMVGSSHENAKGALGTSFVLLVVSTLVELVAGEYIVAVVKQSRCIQIFLPLVYNLTQVYIITGATLD
jgi:hypothetical protein